MTSSVHVPPPRECRRDSNGSPTIGHRFKSAIFSRTDPAAIEDCSAWDGAALKSFNPIFPGFSLVCVYHSAAMAIPGEKQSVQLPADQVYATLPASVGKRGALSVPFLRKGSKLPTQYQILLGW